MGLPARHLFFRRSRVASGGQVVNNLVTRYVHEPEGHDRLRLADAWSGVKSRD
jgi:hypothetical protein